MSINVNEDDKSHSIYFYPHSTKNYQQLKSFGKQ